MKEMGMNMKSSTLRRSTLSKESMEVIENLAKEQENNGTIGEYVRPDEIEDSSKEEINKAQEIDLLWRNFKSVQFASNSPTAYILTGFIIGVIVTSLVFFGISVYAKKSSNAIPTTDMSTVVEETIEQNNPEVQNNTQDTAAQQEENAANTQETTAKTDEKVEETKPAVPVKSKKYIVKNGDTGESIIKHFYGAYTPERAEAIIKLNNLKTLDRINIDQELLIPIEQ